MRLWVDDLRDPPDGWAWVKTSRDAIRILKARKDRKLSVTAMSLDHDLGGDDTTRAGVLWMCENNYWPNRIVVHSANPVGVQWLEGMIERYKP